MLFPTWAENMLTYVDARSLYIAAQKKKWWDISYRISEVPTRLTVTTGVPLCLGKALLPLLLMCYACSFVLWHIVIRFGGFECLAIDTWHEELNRVGEERPVGWRDIDKLLQAMGEHDVETARCHLNALSAYPDFPAPSFLRDVRKYGLKAINLHRITYQEECRDV